MPNEIVKRKIELLKIYIDDMPDYMDIASNSNSAEAKECIKKLEEMAAITANVNEILLAMRNDLSGFYDSPKINLINGGDIDVSERTDLTELCISNK